LRGEGGKRESVVFAQADNSIQMERSKRRKKKKKKKKRGKKRMLRAVVH